MNNAVDKRVVEFEFDNSKFDKNVKRSTSTFEKFKESLEFKDVSNSLDKISVKFSKLEAVSLSVINNITNRIVDMGIAFAKSLSIDNIANGWTKFGEKTISIATLASQTIKVAGKQIDDYAEKMKIINDQLEKLNWFTDETSYNFTDMVNNIGKFTAAGQDLDVAVEAMMGIANWAALSGQNAYTASRAMYQLAQAMGKGYIQLIDWKSIQNANMDTQEFRQIVLDTAVALGELTKEGQNYIAKTGAKFTINQFAEELNAKWFTSGVLTKALAKYSDAVEEIFKISSETGLTASAVIARYGDEFDEFGLKAFRAAQEARTFTDAINSVKDAVSTGWLNTFEKVFGSYTESRQLWTDLANELYEVFAEGGNFRNEILKVWNDLEGRSDLFEHGEKNQGAFWNIYDSIIAIKDTFSDAWETIFPKTIFSGYNDQVEALGINLKNFTKRLQQITANIKTNIKNDSRLQNILTGIFSVLRVIITAIKGIRFAIDPLIQIALNFANRFLNLLSNIGVKLTRTENITNSIIAISNKLYNVISKIIEIVNPDKVLNKIVDGLHNIGSAIKNLFNNAASFLKGKFKSQNRNPIETAVSNAIGIDSENNIIKMAKAQSKALNKATELIDNSIGDIPAEAAYANYVDYVKIVRDLGDQAREEAFLIGDILVEDASAAEEKISVLEQILNVTKTTLGRIYEIIKLIVLTFTNGLINIFNYTSESTQNVNENIEKYNIFIDLFNILEKTIHAFSNIAIKILTILDKTFTVIDALLIDIIDKISKKGVNYLIRLTIGIALLIESFKLLFVSIRSLVYIVESLSVVAYSLENVTKAKVFESFANIIKSIGIGLLEISLAFTLLNGIDWPALVAGGSIIVAIGALMIILSKNVTQLYSGIQIFDNEFSRGINYATSLSNIRDLSYFLTALGFAMLEISLAFKIFNEITYTAEGVAAAVSILSGLAIIPTILAIISKKFGNVESNLSKLYPNLWSLLGLAILVKLFANAFVTLASVPLENLLVPLSGIIILFTAILTMMALAGELSDKNKNMAYAIKAMGSIFASLSLLMLSLGIIANIDSKKIFTAVGAMSTILVALTGFVLLVSNFTAITWSSDPHATAQIVMSLSKIVNSLFTLSLALSILSILNPGKLFTAIGAMSTMLIVLTGVILLISNFTSIGKNSINPTDVSDLLLGMSKIISSIVLLAIGLRILADANFGNMMGGVLALGVLLTVLAIITVKIDKLATVDFNGTRKTLNGMAILIGSLLALSLSLMLLSLIDPSDLIGPVSALSVLMLALGRMMKLIGSMPDPKGITKVLLSTLIPMLGAIIAFVAGAKILESMPIDTLIAYAAGLSVFILAFAGAIMMISSIKDFHPSNILATSAALIALSGSLLILAFAMTQLSNINIMNLALGLAAIGIGILAIIGLSKLIQTGIAPILSLAGAIAAIGVGTFLTVTAIGALIEVFAPFIQSLNENFPLIIEFFKNILNSIQELIPDIKSTIITLGQAILETIKTLGPEIFETIRALVPDLLDTVVVIVKSVLSTIREIWPDLVETIVFIIDKTLVAIRDNIKKWTSDLCQILVGIIEGVAENLDPIVNALFDLVLNLIDSLGKAIKNRAADTVHTFIEFGKNLMAGLWNGIAEGLASLLEGIPWIGKKIASWLRDTLQIHSPSKLTEEMGIYLAEGLGIGVIKGAEETKDDIAEGMANIINAANAAVEESLLNEDNDLVITPILDTSNIKAGARNIAAMLTDINVGTNSVSSKLANLASDQINRQSTPDSVNQTRSVTNNNQTDNYYNTFNIVTDDPEELARETDAILQRNHRQAKAAKGGAY